MAPWKYLLVLSHFLLIILCLATAQPEYLYHFCINNGNYSNGSTYQTNLNTLLRSIPSTINEYGFYNFTAGWEPDRAYAVVLCRGDVDLATCRSCVSDSVSTFTGLCPGYKEVVGWYDSCMLHYSNRSLAGSFPPDLTFYMWNVNNATSVDRFNEALQSLLTDLRSKAAAGGPLRKFAAANTTGPNFQTIFALVQCTPDLSQQDCNDCLIEAISRIPDCCNGKIGGRVVSSVCNLRYEITPFNKKAVQASSPPAPVEAPQPPSTESPTLPSAMDDQMSTLETLQYDFDTIQVATDDFSNANR